MTTSVYGAIEDSRAPAHICPKLRRRIHQHLGIPPPNLQKLERGGYRLPHLSRHDKSGVYRFVFLYPLCPL